MFKNFCNTFLCLLLTFKICKSPTLILLILYRSALLKCKETNSCRIQFSSMQVLRICYLDVLETSCNASLSPILREYVAVFLQTTSFLTLLFIIILMECDIVFYFHLLQSHYVFSGSQ